MSNPQNRHDYYKVDDFSKLRYKINTETGELSTCDEDDYIWLAKQFIINESAPESVKILLEQIKEQYVLGYLRNKCFNVAYEKAIFAFEATVNSKYNEVNGPKYFPNSKNKKVDLCFKIDHLYNLNILPNSHPIKVFHFFREERNNIAHTNSERHLITNEMTTSFHFINIIINIINDIYK